MKVEIIGGGVAGSCAAIALCALGTEVTVREAYATPAGSIGSLVSLSANALHALAPLGVEQGVRARGHEIARHRMWTTTGHQLMDVARGRRSTDSALTICLRRGDLVEELRTQAQAAGARLVLGDRVESPTDLDADLVIGADGIWSATRGVLNPQVPAPRYAGLYTVSGASPASAISGAPHLVEPGAFNGVITPHGPFFHVGLPDGQIWWAAQIAAPEPPDAVLLTSGDGWRERLLALDPSVDAATRIIGAADSIDRPTLMHAYDPVPIWHDERSVIIGDAAHPVGSGQGAAMAVEDALLLAQSIRAVDDGATLDSALAAYDLARRDRISRVIRFDGANKSTKTAGPVKRGLMQLGMRMMTEKGFDRATGWLYDYDPGTLPRTQR